MSTGAPTPRHASLLAQAESLLQQRRCDDALTAFDQAGTAGADENRCDAGRWMCHMLSGNYGNAWLASDAIRARRTPDPNRFWQGEPLTGKRVMLRCLHGYGDTVQYLRWLPQLNELAADVTVQVAPEMLPLLACFPGTKRVITWTAPGDTEPAWDVQVESAELPYLFRATPATLPSPTRIVFPEADIHPIRLRMGQRTRPRVGIVWHGSDFDPARSIPFDLLRTTLFQHHDVEFWSLQPAASNGPWEDLCRRRGFAPRTFYPHGSDGAPCSATIAHMAAFASELDLVITIDTLAAHIAGSLGTPTWLLLKHAADWRWMLDRHDTPWYPGMTLLRQTTPGDWDGVLQRVNNILRDWIEEQGA